MAANGEEVAVASVPLLRFESLCGALRTGLTEAITLKTESDTGAAAFLALQSSAMGLLSPRAQGGAASCHARAMRMPRAPHMDPGHESFAASSLPRLPSPARRVFSLPFKNESPLQSPLRRAQDFCVNRFLEE